MTDSEDHSTEPKEITWNEAVKLDLLPLDEFSMRVYTRPNPHIEPYPKKSHESLHTLGLFGWKTQENDYEQEFQTPKLVFEMECDLLGDRVKTAAFDKDGNGVYYIFPIPNPIRFTIQEHHRCHFMKPTTYTREKSGWFWKYHETVSDYELDVEQVKEQMITKAAMSVWDTRDLYQKMLDAVGDKFTIPGVSDDE